MTFFLGNGDILIYSPILIFKYLTLSLKCTRKLINDTRSKLLGNVVFTPVFEMVKTYLSKIGI